MPEQKPIAFKARKPVKEASQPTETPVLEPEAEIQKPQVETPEPVVAQAVTEEDWEAKIAKAKEEKQSKAEEEEKAADEAAARLSAKLEEKDQLEKPTEESKKQEQKQEMAEPGEVSIEDAEPEEDNAPFKSFWDQNVGTEPVSDQEAGTYEPTDEDKARAAKCKEDKKNDASRILATTLGASNEVVAAFKYITSYLEKYKGLTEEDLQAHPEIRDVLRWVNDLNATVENPMATSQQELMMRMVAALNKLDISLQKLDKRLGISKVPIPTGSSGQPKLFRGDTAIEVLNNRYRGIYRVNLYNSGFWIKIMPLRHTDMDAWLQTVDFDKKQLGRIVGGHFHLGYNVFLKEKLADLLRLSTVDSNLAGWKDGNTLIDSISIHDYDTICWAFACVMNKDGVNISTVCVNPDCRHHNEAQYLDLARLAYVNPDVFTEAAVQWMIAGTAPGITRSQKDIKHYKEDLLKNVKLIKFTDTDYYELKDPSLGEFIRVGTDALGRLAAKVKDGDLSIDSSEVRRYSLYHLTKMLSPWISKIVLKDENNGTIGIIDDRQAITQSLETVMDDKYEVVKQIEEFITKSKVSFYSAVSLKCPVCGHQPNLLKDNIYPLDVEYILFCLSYLKLEQIGVTM